MNDVPKFTLFSSLEFGVAYYQSLDLIVMATFFGEVIYPSSRAFFDDYDDSDDEENSLTNKLPLIVRKQIDDLSLDYEVMFISDGQVASGFMEVYMRQNSDKLIAEFELRKRIEEVPDVLVVKPRRDVSTKLYNLSNNCLLLQVSPSIDIATANQLTMLTAPWLLKCKKVIVVASRHNSHFRCDSINDLPSAFVRALSTSEYPFPEAIKHLEQPNFISDFPASVLSWCESRRKQGLLMLLYSDQCYIDSMTLQPLSKAFSLAGFSSYILNDQTAISSNSSRLRDMDKSFMYM